MKKWLAGVAGTVVAGVITAIILLHVVPNDNGPTVITTVTETATSSTTETLPDINPDPDFPGGSTRVYSAIFSEWPTANTEYGAITYEFGQYVMQPYDSYWIGPGYKFEIPPLVGNFVFDMLFWIEEQDPCAALSVSLYGPGEDANVIEGIFTLCEEGNLTYDLYKGRLKEGFYAVTEEYVAEHESPPSLVGQDWSKGIKVTFKRDDGEMQFFINDIFIKDFPISLFEVSFFSIGASGKSRIVISSIEARQP